ncbi:MAG: VWA domain-containing protein [Bacteriovoracaceae bacterium]|nr:VWA domain-containing protein [Bacteriovoracaceae bacterium]
MFLNFFYTLRNNGAPVSTREYLDFLNVAEQLKDSSEPMSLEKLYSIARTCLIKDVKHFDAYDISFAQCFSNLSSDEDFKSKLMQWLENAKQTELDEQRKLNALDLASEELLKELKDRLKTQKERHDGGNHWVGTGGTSAFGHSCYNPNGVRVGGQSGQRSALAVAGERKFKEYRHDESLDIRNIQVALKKLRDLKKTGRKTLDIDRTVKRTCENMGEIEVVQSSKRKNNLRLILLMDVGGSMTEHSQRVEKLFSAAHQVNHFKSFEAYYFHNVMYDCVYSSASLNPRSAVPIEKLISKFNSEARLIVVGDAYMAPYELFQMTASMRDFYWSLRENPKASSMTGIERVHQLKKAFPKSVWLNPEPKSLWSAPTIKSIKEQFSMHELTLDGIDGAVRNLR